MSPLPCKAQQRVAQTCRPVLGLMKSSRLLQTCFCNSGVPRIVLKPVQVAPWSMNGLGFL